MEEDAVNYPSSSTTSIHEDEELMESGEGWQVAGKGKPPQKRKKNRGNADQPQSKTAKGKMSKEKNSTERWGFTVLRRTNQALLQEMKNLRNLLGEDQIKEIDEDHQARAEGRMLVRLVELCYETMEEKHKGDVGPFLPNITDELLHGPYGSPPVNDENEDESEDESEDEDSMPESQVAQRLMEIEKTDKKEWNNHMGFTVVASNSRQISTALKYHISNGANILVGEEMGPSYQQPAADRQLIILPEYYYLSLATYLYHSVGNWVPSITPELLTSGFGVRSNGDFYQIDLEGLVSWVSDQHDQG
jgi:hypothetical protein